MSAYAWQAELGRRAESRRSTFNRRGPDVATGTLGIAACCVLAFMYGPIVTLIVFSFNSNPVTRLPLTEWTLDWYIKAFNNPDLLAALANSGIVRFCPSCSFSTPNCS